LGTDRQVILPKGRRTGISTWRDISVDLKLIFGLIAMAETYDSLVFSLNLGEDLTSQLTPGSKDTRDIVRKRIADSLKSKFGYNIPFIMILEVEEQGRLHVHGALGLRHEDVAKATSALRRAGGKWTGAGDKYQVDVQEMYDAVGWWTYITKYLRRQPAVEQGQWVGWSQPAKRMAKAWHEIVRNWWTENCTDLDIRHSMHFYLGDTSLADEVGSRRGACLRLSMRATLNMTASVGTSDPRVTLYSRPTR
jgi:hypothetical protein